MKKVVIVMGVYAAIIFLMCLVGSFLTPIPVLVAGTEGTYKFVRSVQWVLTMLPDILFSGFVVACGVVWQKQTSNSFQRFSAGMFNRYKMCVAVSIACVLVLSLNSEVFLKLSDNHVRRLETAPEALESAFSSARRLLNQNKEILSFQYAKKALEIAPSDPDAIAMYKMAKDAVDIAHDKEIYQNLKIKEKIQKPLHDIDAGYTPLQLIQKSRDAAEKKEWFNAHYWAQLAVDACNGTNTNLPEASAAANFAWKMLNKPEFYDNSVEAEYYRKKKEGYKAFNSGDSLKAYYIFLSLSMGSMKGSSDPDVLKFLDLAREDIENQYFFFDETENMTELANSKNIYFTLQFPDNTKGVFYIESAMDIKKEGGLVRYLEGLNFVRYSPDGTFLHSMSVPYAKVQACPVTEFDDDFKAVIGIKPGFKNVPMITMQSVDRNTEGIVVRPSYNYTETGIPIDILIKKGIPLLDIDEENYAGRNRSENVVNYEVGNKNSMILPMSFTDFYLINEASSGADNMLIPDLWKFVNCAKDYGFAAEVFTENLIQRLTYPLILLILFIMCASVGWNYRIEGEKSVFKFRWIALIPVFSVIVHVIYNAALYAFTMANYVMAGIFGAGSVAVAFVVYLVLFVAMSIIFLSRKV